MESPEETSRRTGPAVASATGSGPTGSDASDPAASAARSRTISDLTVFTEGHASRSMTVGAPPASDSNAAASANGSATGRNTEANASPAFGPAEQSTPGVTPASDAGPATWSTTVGVLPTPDSNAATSANGGVAGRDAEADTSPAFGPAVQSTPGVTPASDAGFAARSTRSGNLPASAEGPTSPRGSAPPAPDSDAAARRQRVFDFLDAHDIRYTWYEHPEAPTIDLARRYWRDDGSKHCKNLFFRNHKGDRHYLVCIDCDRSLAIHHLEQRLRQGKLTFASPERMERWLGLRPGSVSPFGLINDPANHVHLFLDADLRRYPAYSFHPNDNRATVVIAAEEFLRYLAAVGNSYEFIELY